MVSEIFDYENPYYNVLTEVLDICPGERR